MVNTNLEGCFWGGKDLLPTYTFSKLQKSFLKTREILSLNPNLLWFSIEIESKPKSGYNGNV